jgi:hypothetical protein
MPVTGDSSLGLFRTPGLTPTMRVMRTNTKGLTLSIIACRHSAALEARRGVI